MSQGPRIGWDDWILTGIQPCQTNEAILYQQNPPNMLRWSKYIGIHGIILHPIYEYYKTRSVS